MWRNIFLQMVTFILMLWIYCCKFKDFELWFSNKIIYNILKQIHSWWLPHILFYKSYGSVWSSSNHLLKSSSNSSLASPFQFPQRPHIPALEYSSGAKTMTRQFLYSTFKPKSIKNHLRYLKHNCLIYTLKHIFPNT